MRLADIHSDLTQHVIRFLNAKDSGRLSRSSKRFYYLVHEFRRLRGPELATAASCNGVSSGQQLDASAVFRKAIEGLQQQPNLILSFATDGSRYTPHVGDLLQRPGVSLLGVVASDIQVNTPATEKGAKPKIEHASQFSMLVGCFPRAQVQPFAFDIAHSTEDVRRTVNRFKSNTIGDYPCTYNDQSASANTLVQWKAAIVYACGRSGTGMIETVVGQMQAAFPDLAIVGGICDACHVRRVVDREQLASMTVRQLRVILRDHGQDNYRLFEKSELVDTAYGCLTHGAQQVEIVDNAIRGVLLGGEIPIRSMVSRGVKSVFQGTPRSTSLYCVEEADLLRPRDSSYIFRPADGEDDSDLYPYHTVRSVRNRETGKLLSASELMRLSSMTDNPQFIGLRRPSEDGFYLSMLSPFTYHLGTYLIMTEGFQGQEETLVGADIDLYSLDGEALMDDMRSTVAALKEHTQNEQILGAIMFSCNGRGPKRNHFMPDVMADAKLFAEGFPMVPCLGCYCGGEVGPLAKVGKKSEVFQTGHAAVQGFTAVFALFIVPSATDRLRFHLDDSDDSVNAFVRNRLSASR